MGSSASKEPTSLRKQDLKFLGDRCPFGDAELSHLYQVYLAMQVGGQTPQEQCTSFLTDLAVKCMECSQLRRKQPKVEGNEIESLENVTRVQNQRALLIMLEQDVLPAGFGSRLYETSFRDPGDGKPDEMGRRGQLEKFFDGLSNCTRRGSKASLKVLFAACSQKTIKENPPVKAVSALEFVDLGYRLALATELIREFGSEDAAIDDVYRSPVDSSTDSTLISISKSMLEHRCSRKKRMSPFGHTNESSTASDEPGDHVELEDILEWSEAVSPLFGNILSSFFYDLLFHGRAGQRVGTFFEYPRISHNSAFFHGPNSTLLFMFGILSPALTGSYYRLYTTDDDGLSFNRLMNALLGYAGPTLIVIRTVSESKEGANIFGAFTASPWKESKDFYGNSDCFLFQASPRTSVYRPSGNGSNFMYCNSNARSRGYDKQAHGIGFGGSVDQPRLFLAESSLVENSSAGSRDMTFAHGNLLTGGTSATDSQFELAALEVWGVGGTDMVEQALKGRDKARDIKASAIQRSRKVDKAMFLDDLRSGAIESKAFAHRGQVDGRADPELHYDK